MPYPESCPECCGPFRNTGTHFTARRQEAGRRVLMELGCKNTGHRFWWDFTSGRGSEPVKPPTPSIRDAVRATPTDLPAAQDSGRNGRHVAAVLERPVVDPAPVPHAKEVDMVEPPVRPAPYPEPLPEPAPAPEAASDVAPSSEPQPPTTESGDLRALFLRQLEIDRLTLRRMHEWLPSQEARQAADVAASATEATYERLALALFGTGLISLQGPGNPVALPAVLSADERLEIQREKARVRARNRRALLKAQQRQD